MNNEPDITTFTENAIFTPFTKYVGVPFEEYFNKNLNPDESEGNFLEELDCLMQTAKERKVIIHTQKNSGKDNQVFMLAGYLNFEVKNSKGCSVVYV